MWPGSSAWWSPAFCARLCPTAVEGPAGGGDNHQGGLKAALAENPKSEALKGQIRDMDLQLRTEYMKQRDFAARGGAASGRVGRVPGCGEMDRRAAARTSFAPTGDDPGRSVAVGRRGPLGGRRACRGAAGGGRRFDRPLWPLAQFETGPRDGRVCEIGGGMGPFPSDEEIAKAWPRFRGPVARASLPIAMCRNMGLPFWREHYLEDRRSAARQQFAGGLGQSRASSPGPTRTTARYIASTPPTAS